MKKQKALSLRPLHGSCSRLHGMWRRTGIHRHFCSRFIWQHPGRKQFHRRQHCYRCHGFWLLHSGSWLCLRKKYPQLIVNACYENLFKFYENNGTPQPCLADTYEFSEDGLTLTVKLKDGLTFASGNKITSADVAFSINRTKNLKGNPSFICDTIESIETPDDATVIFHLNQPDSAILSKLTYSSLAILTALL